LGGGGVNARRRVMPRDADGEQDRGRRERQA
jgi:hypothetical protein